MQAVPVPKVFHWIGSEAHLGNCLSAYKARLPYLVGSRLTSGAKVSGWHVNKESEDQNAMIKRKVFLPLLLGTFSVWASAQNSYLTSISPENGGSAGRTHLSAESGVPVIEPLSKRFRMNIPFAKAAYSDVSSANATAGHQYVWDNFSEGFVMLQYFEYPAGTIPKTADAQMKWTIDRAKTGFAKGGVETISEKDIKVGDIAGKQYEAKFRGRNATIRTFSDGDVYYVLTFLPVPDGAGPTIEKLFDSFEFVKQ